VEYSGMVKMALMIGGKWGRIANVTLTIGKNRSKLSSWPSQLEENGKKQQMWALL